MKSAAASSGTGASVLKLYTFVTCHRGLVNLCTKAPSSLSSNSPVVFLSNRPTHSGHGFRRSHFSGSNSKIRLLPASATCEHTYPAGLCRATYIPFGNGISLPLTSISRASTCRAGLVMSEPSLFRTFPARNQAKASRRVQYPYRTSKASALIPIPNLSPFF